jgi:hypothetical protein
VTLLYIVLCLRLEAVAWYLTRRSWNCSTLPNALQKVCGRSSLIYQELTSPQGLHALSRLGVDHRDVSIGNVLLGTDPEKAAGFISDLDLSSISEEAIKAAYPNDHEKIIEQLKDGEWRTVR